MSKAIALIQRYWRPLLTLNGFLIVVTVCSALFSPRVWTANTQLILPDTTTNLDASLGTLGELKDQGIAFTNELSPLKVQASIITSDDVIRPIWQADPERDKFKELISYKKLFKVKAVDQATTIQVEVKGSHLELAKQRAEQLVKSYEQRLNDLRRGTSDTREHFTQDQLTQAEHNLANAKNALAAYRQATGLVDSDEQIKKLVGSIQDLVTAQAQAASQSQAAFARTQTLAQRLGLTPTTAFESLKLSQNKEYQSMRQKLTEVETALAANKGVFTADSPQLQSLLVQQRELQMALRQRLIAVLPNPQGVDASFGGNPSRDGSVDLITQLIQAESDSQSLRQQADQLQRQISVLRSSLAAISTQQTELLDLQRQYDIAEGLYKGIVAQLEQAKITAFNSYPNVQVLDQPSVAPKPTSPKNSLIALGWLLASIFGSAALVSFLESQNPLLKPKDIQAIEFPVLVRIPQFKEAARALTGTGVTEIEFQRLASAVSLMPLPNRRVLVSSSIAREGKTTVALGLAMALVDLGFRVLVVDGDFHKAELSRRLGYTLTAEVGTSPEPVAISARLDLLPAVLDLHGKVVEFIARGQFERRLDAVQTAGNYDYVIIDSAPVSATSETALMAKAIRNVLLVIRLGVSDRSMLQEALDQLMRHSAQIIGLSVNGVEQRSEGYSYKPTDSRVSL